MSDNAGDPRYAAARALLRRALNDDHADFRAGQWEAVRRLVEERARLLVVQRTGWGKSLVYFLATRLLRERGAGLTLLISPLLALMRNQILAAQRLGISAATINSANQDDWPAVRAAVQAGHVDLLLVSPERLANDEFRQRVLAPVAGHIGLLVVDEAHCISDWGHDFRPDYRRIVRIVQALPSTVPVLATTATANDRVVKDVAAQLGQTLQVMRGPLVRASLRLQNIHLSSPAARMAWLAHHLPSLPGSGIVYTLTVRDAQRVAEWLRTQGIDAGAYWGGLEGPAREALEERLLGNQIKALVATTALGMGFDKPDLGFVIHFQRPGSVVHYYQQVGRAGRALDHAYGIMLSGDEDEEISDYFIQTAFPPEAHVEEVLRALDEAQDGLTLTGLEAATNLSRSQLMKVLKLLAVETPAPVIKEGSRWYAGPVSYTPDRQKIERLIAIRHQEQARMRAYLHSRDCLMAFLCRELDDPRAEPCGRCAACAGRPVLSESYPPALAHQAALFLRRGDQEIEPRRQWPGNALAAEDWRGAIPPALQAEPGRALSRWGDGGWGDLVKRGKLHEGRFSDELVRAAVELLRQRWQPEPAPAWVTCVPSLTHPTLVAGFAERLARAVRLPFVPCVKKVRPTEPQKRMQNSYHQARNLAGAFSIEPWAGIGGAVLLVDDMVDSRWTFTVVAALLRAAGSGPVFPLALAQVDVPDG
jgi:ATP-dependent DNA helicase RecQ